MKKHVKIITALALVFSLLLSMATAAASTSLIATPNASTIYVDGNAVAFDAYTINQENYIKLRDVAYTLNGTRVQFDMSYDGMINLIRGKAYTPDGSEMKAKGTVNKTPTLNKSKIMLDGKDVELTAYTIEGNNYFKLRELAQTFDFAVGYNNDTKAIAVNTKNTYADNTAAPTPVPASIEKFYKEFPNVPNFGYYANVEPASFTESLGIYEYAYDVKKIKSGGLTEWGGELDKLNYKSATTENDKYLKFYNDSVMILFELTPTFVTIAIGNIGASDNIFNAPDPAPVMIDEIQINITALPKNSIGTIYMEATYRNESPHPFKRFQLTVVDKSTGNKRHLTSYDTVLKFETSPKMKTFGPESGKTSDLEYLTLEYTVLIDGKDVRIEYDYKLDTYAVK